MTSEATAAGDYELNQRILAASREWVAARLARPRDTPRVDAARELVAALSEEPLDEERVATAQAEVDRLREERDG